MRWGILRGPRAPGPPVATVAAAAPAITLHIVRLAAPSGGSPAPSPLSPVYLAPLPLYSRPPFDVPAMRFSVTYTLKHFTCLRVQAQCLCLAVFSLDFLNSTICLISVCPDFSSSLLPISSPSPACELNMTSPCDSALGPCPSLCGSPQIISAL